MYTIKQSTAPAEKYQSYLMAATRCQQQIFEIAEQDSLASRYCLVLEELRIEALQQTQHPMVAPVNGQDPSTLNGAMNSTAVVLSSDTRGVAPPAGPFTFPDGTGTGDFAEFHISPDSSLADMTGWGHFESMVSDPFLALNILEP